MKILNCLILVLLLAPLKLFSCTGILLYSTNNSTVNGRTVEFGTELKMNVAVVPRNYQFFGKTPLGNGLSYTSKYGVVGAYCFSDQIIMDGINEKGLTAAAFFFPGYANYAPTTSMNQKSSMSPIDFTNWILTQFSTIEEVLEALPTVSIAPTVIDGWGESAPPFHYIVYDSTGKSIVIEPLDGQLVSYKNPIGTMTNSPTFDWHITELNNYINLSPYNSKPMQMRGLTLENQGQGSGLNGLPGDFSSTSRFTRASFFSNYAIQPPSAQQLPNQAFHILNQFDIPMGSIRQEENGNTQYDYTQLTTVKDPNSMRYFYRSYQDQSIKFIDLNNVNFNSSTIKSMLISGSQQNQDITTQLN